MATITVTRSEENETIIDCLHDNGKASVVMLANPFTDKELAKHLRWLADSIENKNEDWNVE